MSTSDMFILLFAISAFFGKEGLVRNSCFQRCVLNCLVNLERNMSQPFMFYAVSMNQATSLEISIAAVALSTSWVLARTCTSSMPAFPWQRCSATLRS